jgi:hypothetical protein
MPLSLGAGLWKDQVAINNIDTPTKNFILIAALLLSILSTLEELDLFPT